MDKKRIKKGRKALLKMPITIHYSNFFTAFKMHHQTATKSHLLISITYFQQAYPLCKNAANMAKGFDPSNIANDELLPDNIFQSLGC